MAIQESSEPPDRDSLELAAERLGIRLDAELRGLLDQEGDPVVIAAHLRKLAAAPSPQRDDPSSVEFAGDPERSGPPRGSAAGHDERKVTIRVDAERYGVLEELGAQEGIPPTTIARLLFNRALRDAERCGGFGA
jgi:hypothetical protein